MHQQSFQLTGLTCESCAKFTSKRIGQIDGVAETKVDLDSMVAVVTASRIIEIAELRSVLESTHYGVGSEL